LATHRGTRRRRGIAAAALLLPFALAGCGGEQNTLNPHSHAATDIANLFWVTMAISFGGLALVTGLMVAAWIRRGRRGTASHPGDREAGERLGNRVVIALGVVLPIGVVCALFVVANTLIINVTQAPAASSTSLTVHAIGHQWWWQFEYPGTGADTADELHIPVDTRVNLVATTADVIHSFWVPALNRKIDTIPSQRNRITLYSNKVGVFRGQCAEYCGLQHAHMAMLVIVQPKAAFRAWLRHEASDARPPTTAAQKAGQKVFLDGPCSSCHAIRGTSASGYVGPDLTHLADRKWLAGLAVRNRPGDLAGWIVNSQHVLPGNEMPDMNLTGSQLGHLLSYLESLR
jgi:cytochrome c oxidase subunit 2